MDFLSDPVLVDALRDSCVWQLLFEQASPAERREVAIDWLTLYYGPEAVAEGLTDAEILAAFWIQRDALMLVFHAAWNGAGRIMRTLERGLSMADAEALIRDAAA